jgi:rubrerythrin
MPRYDNPEEAMAAWQAEKDSEMGQEAIASADAEAQANIKAEEERKMPKSKEEIIEKLMEINYPEHKHPHGINNLLPNEYRIWVCDECGHIFTDEEARDDESKGWGHSCKSHPHRKGQRCESHLEPYLPELLKELFNDN